MPTASSRPLIAHITEPVTGGVGRQIELVARTLPAQGFRLHLLLSLGRAPEYESQVEAYREQGIGVDVVPMVRSPCPLRDSLAYVRLRRALERLQPDLVHTHSSKGGILGRRATHALGLPTVHTPHVFAFEWAATGLRGVLYRYLERRAAAWCDRLILLSDAQRELAFDAGLGPIERLEVIPNGVDAATFAPPSAAERQTARQHFGIGERVPLVGMAARFEPQKGVGHFLRAAAGLRQRLPCVCFLLAGEGALLSEAKTRAAALGLTDAVRFCGNVSHMAAFYHALDAFVLASLWEGCPYVILEAQACRLPVIATRTCGAEALIEDGETGLLVPIGDEAALARRMERVLENRDLAAHLAAWGHARVREHYTLERWMNTLTQLYRQVIAERTAAASTTNAI